MNVLIHALVHVPVEFGKGKEIFSDRNQLVCTLFQKALCYDVLDIFAHDENLLESVFDPLKAGCYEGETRAVEDGLLEPCNETEPEILADLADLAEKVEIEDDLLIFPGLQIIKELIYH